MEEPRPIGFIPSVLRRSSLFPLFACALTATALVLPICFAGNPSGHDLQPHLASWMDVQGQWREGIWFPRWAEWSNFGFGEPRFIFYPPLSGLIGAALGSILPWQVVPGIIAWLCLLLAGMCMYKLANDWLNPQQAIIASVLFAANPYNIVLVYYRSAFAELMAAALFPLLIWAAIGVAGRNWKRAPAMSITFAAIWLTNAPAAVIATYAVMALVSAYCVRHRDLRPLLPTAACGVTGLGLAAFYVLPAWWEQRWIDVAALVAGDGNPSRSFLFSQNNDPIMLKFNWLVSGIAVSLMLMTVVAVAFAWRHRRTRADFVWTMIVLAMVSALLMLPLSGMVWRSLPALQFTQFPWRWVTVLAIAFAGLAASAITPRTKFFWFVAIFICGSAVALSLKVTWGRQDVSTVAQKFASASGYFSTTNFTPLGASRFTLAEHAPLLEQLDEKGELAPLPGGSAQVSQWSAERKQFSIQTNEQVTLALKLLNYPAWEVLVDGQPVKAESFKPNGQMLISVSAGEHAVDVRFRRTRDRTIGGVISAVSMSLFLIIMVVCGRCARRSKTGRPSQPKY
jgi:uncharacterized membrane protein